MFQYSCIQCSVQLLDCGLSVTVTVTSLYDCDLSVTVTLCDDGLSLWPEQLQLEEI